MKAPTTSDDEVADQPEAGTLYDLTGEPSCNDADHDYHEKTFTRHVHLRKLQVGHIAGIIRLRCRSIHSTRCFACLLCRFAHIERPLVRSNDQYCTDIAPATGPVLPVRGAGVGGDPAGIGPDNPAAAKKKTEISEPKASTTRCTFTSLSSTLRHK